MRIVNGFDLLNYCKNKGWILPAFNTTNLEVSLGIIEGLQEVKMPGYIQISSSNLKLSSPKLIASIVKEGLKNNETPIGLHLDHGTSFQDVKDCVDAGFSSIMIDGSHLAIEENIKLCREVSDYCHFYNIPVEVELGSIGGKEDEIIGSEGKTNPEMVAEFIERTNCDTLAVAIGNVHGFDAIPNIDLELLEKIYQISTVPLVLHGGSGIPMDTIRKAKKFGLIKINYGAAVRRAFISTFGVAYEKNHGEYDLLKLSKEAVKNVKEVVKEITLSINS